MLNFNIIHYAYYAFKYKQKNYEGGYRKSQGYPHDSIHIDNRNGMKKLLLKILYSISIILIFKISVLKIPTQGQDFSN